MLQKFKELAPIAQIGAMVAVAIVIAGAFMYMVIKPTYEDNAENSKKLEQIEASNRELSQYKTKLADLERQITSLQQQMAIQRQIVPDEKAVPDFIRVMQQTATDAGVNLRRFDAMAISHKEYYTEVPFGIEVDGPYYAVMNFFDRVSKLERIVNVDQLRIAGLKAKQKQNPEKVAYEYTPPETVAVACVAKTYFSSSAEAPAADAKKK